MPTYLVGRMLDPVLGVATGVMAYYMWEHDDRNIDQRPPGRMLNELIQRRLTNTPPPARLFAGVEATETSLLHIPAISRNSRTSEHVLKDARAQASQQGERGADLRALRTAITDEWGQQEQQQRRTI